MALFAIKFELYFEVSVFGGIEDVHDFLFADALEVDKHFFQD